jgi:hypothetical protein
VEAWLAGDIALLFRQLLCMQERRGPVDRDVRTLFDEDLVVGSSMNAKLMRSIFSSG